MKTAKMTAGITLVTVANRMLVSLGMKDLLPPSERELRALRSAYLREMWKENADMRRSHLVSSPLRYCFGLCFLNAEWNRTHAYAPLNLHLVIGTLAFNGWEEYGGSGWDEEKWLEMGRKEFLQWDAHCWLEDDEGNVYDYCFDRYLEFARIQTGRTGRMKVGVLERASRADCMKRGLKYTPAPAAIQTMVKDEMMEGGLIVE